MTTPEIIAHLQSHFPNAILAAHVESKHPRIEISVENWRAVAEHLYKSSDLQFDWLRCLSAIDYAADQKMACVYDLWSFHHKHFIAVKVFMPRDNPHMATVCDLWPAADWQEREAFDMFGIIFDNHPDLRRILLADDWVGYPLRKDYVFPREYHGIPGSVELDWQQQPNYPKK
jgi:NADH-quinone oxidoreductase subunit C